MELLLAIKLTVASMQVAFGGCFLLLNLWRQNKFYKYKQFISPHTSPKPPKYSLIFSSGVSGDKPPTKIFLMGSFVFIALALFGSMTFPFSLCSFWSMTCGKLKHDLTRGSSETFHWCFEQGPVNLYLVFVNAIASISILWLQQCFVAQNQTVPWFWSLSTDVDSSDKAFQESPGATYHPRVVRE